MAEASKAKNSPLGARAEASEERGAVRSPASVEEVTSQEVETAAVELEFAKPVRTDPAAVGDDELLSATENRDEDSAPPSIPSAPV